MTMFFWFVPPCSSENNRRFGGIYRLHFLRCAGSLIFARFLHGLLFDHEDGDDVFLQNAGLFPNYTALQPRRTPSSYISLLSQHTRRRKLTDLNKQEQFY
jgi:hypothetical protein